MMLKTNVVRSACLFRRSVGVFQTSLGVCRSIFTVEGAILAAF